MPTTPTIDSLINVADSGRAGLLVATNQLGTGAMAMLVRSDGEQLSIRCVTPSSVSGSYWNYLDISSALVEVAIGEFNQSPTAGSEYFMVGPALTSGSLITGKQYVVFNYAAGDNFTNIGGANFTLYTFTATGTTPTTWTNGSQVYEITAAIPCGSNAATVATALNATAAITAAGGVTVVLLSTGNYVVTFVIPGTRYLIQGNGVLLQPLSSIISQRIQTGTTSVQEIQLLRVVVNPYCYATPSTALPAAAATVAQLQTGASGVPSIQSVTINANAYGGAFNMIIPGVGGFVINQGSTAAQVQAQIGTGTVAVTNPTGQPNVYIFTWLANGAQTAITANAVNLLVPIGVTGPLITNTEGVLAAFARQGMPETINLWYQVKLTFPGQSPRTVLLVQVEVSSTVIDTATILPAPLPSYYTQAQCNALFVTYAGATFPNSDPHVVNTLYRNGAALNVSLG
jgi:hypothetical protein